MNVIQGITTHTEQGIHIRHEPNKDGVLVIGTNIDDDVRIRVREKSTVISGEELLIDMKNIYIPVKEQSYLFPSYLSITETGKIIVRDDRYLLLGLALFMVIKLVT
jgi:hypothetical protein